MVKTRIALAAFAALALVNCYAKDELKPVIGYWVADEAATMADLKAKNPDLPEEVLKDKLERETSYMMEIDDKAMTLHQGSKPFVDVYTSIKTEGKTIKVQTEGILWTFTPTGKDKIQMSYFNKNKFLRRATEADKKRVADKIAERTKKREAAMKAREEADKKMKEIEKEINKK